MTLGPKAVERFRTDLEQLCPDIVSGDQPIALAVSGGADSMVMLSLCAAAFPGRAHAATFDHQLRPASAGEADMVAAYCAKIAVSHRTLLPGQPIVGGSVQAQARAARYEELGAWAEESGASTLLTAHHADDQAETFLMRAARGSGVQGLAAIPPVRPLATKRGRGVRLVRPLLDWRSAELRAIAQMGAIPFVDDPSNSDFRYDRARFRALLAKNPELDVTGLAAAARNIREAEESLGQMAAQFWDANAALSAGEVRIPAHNLNVRDQQRRLVRRAIQWVRDQEAIMTRGWNAGSNVEAMIDALVEGRVATLAGVKAQNQDGIWIFSKTPPHRSH